MAEPAERRMTADEFLTWEDGTDTRYELADGVPVAMPVPDGPHRTIVPNAAGEIHGRLRHRSPCHAEASASIRISEWTQWQADIAVTCHITRHGPVQDPLLIVEVLSPSTHAKGLDRKLGDYKTLPSLREVWLIDSERRWAQIWWREPEGWHGRDYIGSAVFKSGVLEGGVSLDELCLSTEF